jgi:hypothetical protein
LGNKEAEKKFRQVRIAYETLIHPDKRKQYDSINSKKHTSSNAVFARKAFQSIKIIVPNRIVTTDEIFEVIVRASFPTANIHLQGLHLFHLTEEPKTFKGESFSANNAPVFQIKYKLKAKQTGYLAIGPASVLIKNIRYESDIIFVKAKEPGSLPFVKNNERFEKIILRFAFGILFSLAALITYNINTYGIKNLNGNYEKVKYNTLPTGSIPYAYFKKTEQVDSLSNNLIRIKNKPYIDAVIFLVNKNKKEVVRHHYIKANDTFEINFIPDGQYFIKIIFGNNWSSEAEMLNNNNCKGGFLQDISYVAFTNQVEILDMQHQLKNGSVLFSNYEITLNTVSDGNAKGINTSAKNFLP